MSAENQQIHLVLERPPQTACAHGPVISEPRAGNVAGPRPTVANDGKFPVAAQNSPQIPALAVAPEPAWLVSQPGGLPRLTNVKPARTAALFLVEPVTQRRQLRLLLVCPQERRVRVNGVIAPRYVLLKEKDCVDLDADVALHVTMFNRPAIGPVSVKLVGKECPVCRVPFAANSRSYSCSCGAAMHCENDGAKDGLQCAQLRSGSGCPVCQRPVVLKQGYSYLPEVANE